MGKKFLIIRLSSIGDIIQCMPVIDSIKNKFPNSEIHWFTRKDMTSILEMDKRIDKIWGFDRKDGFKGIINKAKELKNEKYDYVYDAHSNIRSNIIKFFLLPIIFRNRKNPPYYTLRSKERFKRFLLFRLGINQFPKPYRGVESYLNPLKNWGMNNFTRNKHEWSFPIEYNSKFQEILNIEKLITIVPSANWEMKRWPVMHWKKLIQLLDGYTIVILAGPNDTFCEEIANIDNNRVINLAGKTSILESCYIVSKSKIVVSGDTGFMHAADLFNTKCIALIGPTAFGYPFGASVTILEKDLPCKPCSKDGRGKCKQNIWQKCMVDISPECVLEHIKMIEKEQNTSK